MLIIVAIIAVLGLAVTAVLYPLFRIPANEIASEQEDVQVQDLLVQQDNTYQAIRDLEFDLKMGKLSEEDFETFSVRLKGQAGNILRQLSLLGVSRASSTTGLEDTLEDRIRTRRKGKKPHSKPSVQRFCTSCGKRLPSGARFCPNCGESVEEITNP